MVEKVDEVTANGADLHGETSLTSLTRTLRSYATSGNGSNGGTVTAVDKANADYDVVTLAEGSTLAASKGAVLFEATAVGGKTPKATANFLNYAWTKVVEGATITAVGQAYEIRPTRLIAPISEKDKATLGARFMFTY